MPFSKTPTDWIASWSVAGTTISFPIASLTGLTASKADGATGDIRDIMFSLMETIWTEWDSLASSAQPAKMVMFKQTSGNTSNQVKRTHRLIFTTTQDSETVAAE